MALLRLIQVVSYVAGILAGIGSLVVRAVPMGGQSAHGMLYVAMTCFLCSIATKFLAEAFEPKEVAKSRAAAA